LLHGLARFTVSEDQFKSFFLLACSTRAPSQSGRLFVP
jgi:hypothetical protein